VAEIVAGELARALGLPVPELVLVDVDPALGRAEPDPEIQDLISASAGSNLGVDFLPGAFPYTPGKAWRPESRLAADIVWLDALTTNVDRTPRNPNLLVWHSRTWLIDHGASFYRQHGEAPLAASPRAPFPLVRDHVLLPRAASVAEADERLAEVAGPAVAEAVALVPDSWLGERASERRADFEAFLHGRLEAPREFVAEAEGARA
jgi:hypothetical protein